MDLVQFQPEPDRVEHEDDFELIPSLKFGREHQHLCEYAHEQNKIVAGHKRNLDVFRQSECRENDDGKNAAQRLPVAEQPKRFHHTAPPGSWVLKMDVGGGEKLPDKGARRGNGRQGGN